MPGPGMMAMTMAASRNSEKFVPLISLVRPRQTERHHLLERRLHRRRWKQRQRIDRHRAVMLGAVDGVFQPAVLGHQPDGVVEIATTDLAALQCFHPERAFAVIAAAEGEDDR